MSEAYIPPAVGAVSIWFATPAPTVSDIVGQLLASSRAKHAHFGIQPTQVTSQIARDLGLGQMTGVAVLDVVAGGPADRAGIRPGDVLWSPSLLMPARKVLRPCSGGASPDLCRISAESQGHPVGRGCGADVAAAIPAAATLVRPTAR